MRQPRLSRRGVQALGDGLDVEASLGDGPDEAERGVVVELHRVAVEVEEHDGGQPTHPRVAELIEPFEDIRQQELPFGA